MRRERYTVAGPDTKSVHRAGCSGTLRHGHSTGTPAGAATRRRPRAARRPAARRVRGPAGRWSPAVVHLRTDALVVQVGDRGQALRRQLGDVRGSRVATGLLDVAGP